MLLPLLMKEEFIYKRFLIYSLSAILATVQRPTSPATKESPSVVPTLKAYGVSLEDRHAHENLLRDLFLLNKKHNKTICEMA
jgi:hypothetical protein